MDGEEMSGMRLDVPMDRWEKSLIRLNFFYLVKVVTQNQASRFILLFFTFGVHRESDVMIFPFFTKNYTSVSVDKKKKISKFVVKSVA